jgi:hypothetical protein
MSGLNTLWLRVFQGVRAVIFQSYTEANVKLGRQRVASTILTVNAGATNHIGSTRIEYYARSDLAFTGAVSGNIVPIRNPNNITKVPIGFQMWHSVTPVAPTGATVQYLDPFPIFAAGINAQSRIGGDTLGLEYILKPNTSHVFSIANTGTGNATVHWWQSQYEGPLDLPLNE